MSQNIKICLNMIVKNESKIITRLFDTVLPIIDYWIISDTGSTDDTPDIITRYFSEKNIPGSIHSHKWKNFGHNRTLALIDAQKSDYDFDYILLLDADMKLVIGPNFSKKMLIHDVYTIQQGGSHIGYYNTRLLKKKLEVKCVSPTHEYYDIITKNHTQTSLSPEYLRIDDIGDGGAKHDKYERDIRLLKEGIEEEPNNARYYFYLAQSYKCIDDHENAIKYYQKRTEMGGWNEEIWISFYEIGNIYNKLNEHDKAVYNYLMAYNINQARAENIYEIAKLYRFKEKYHLANHFTDMGKNIIKSKKLIDSQTLFKQPQVYSYLLDYEKSIDAYYSGELDEGLKISNNLILNKNNLNMEYSQYQQVIENLKFYAKRISNYGGEYIKLLERNKLVLDENKIVNDTDMQNKDTEIDKNPLIIKNHVNIFNPSITFTSKGLIINLRCSNYDMKVQNGNLEYKVYKNSELLQPDDNNPVSTINLICELDKELNIKNNNLLEVEQNKFNFPFSVRGIEDVRIIEFDGGLYFIGNSREVSPDNSPKMILGKYSITENKVTNMVRLFGYGDDKCQKNWSPFIYNEKLLFVYSFDPLIILEPDLETGECTVHKNTNQKYNYSMLRGGSQGFYINGDLYFITHEVVFDNGRIYFHRFVKMTKDLNIEKVSYPFFFKDWGIEYVAGATYYENNKILISWGSNDKNAHLSSIDTNKWDSLWKD
jgi:tetratricopeptide (TPR) repeat protein